MEFLKGLATLGVLGLLGFWLWKKVRGKGGGCGCASEAPAGKLGFTEPGGCA